ncbi:MAG: hypothetical protein OXC95_12275 [Dehalococcoidia bacterium]|nr:hypothetical protein [Dehalococcoidia bacterium]
MDLEEFGLGELELLDGERITAKMQADRQGGRQLTRESGSLLLTDNRIIHISGEGDRRQTTMISVQDIESVSVRLTFSEGIGPYLWAALSLALGLILYSYIEHTIGRIAIPLIILAMGAYLVIDRVTERGRPSAIFKAREAEIQWPFDSKNESKEVYDFINSVYRTKRASSYNLDEWLSLH